MKNYIQNLAIASIATLGLSVASASAQDVNWTGATVGLTYGNSEIEAIASGLSLTFGSDRARGAFVGYDYQMSQFVVGAGIHYKAWEAGTANVSTSDFSVRGGYAMGRGLAYASVGKTRMNIQGASGSLDGNAFGVGYDYMVTDSIVIGGAVTMQTYSVIPGVKLTNKAFELRAGYKF